MKFFKEDLKHIQAFVFDVDGVISSNLLVLHPSGDMMRTVNTRDGYSMKLALDLGYRIAIITGAKSTSLKVRFHDLGTDDVYLGSKNKVADLEDFANRYGLDPKHILYMGDDLPDLEAMKRVGMPTCPSDAVHEIQAVSRYHSSFPGGEGCVRDVIEQVLRAQHRWNVG